MYKCFFTYLFLFITVYNTHFMLVAEMYAHILATNIE